MSPELLESISGYGDLCNKAAEVLESMYGTELPREVHACDLIKRELPLYHNSCRKSLQGTRGVARALIIPPDPEEKKKEFHNHVHATVCTNGIHRHCLTCRKPPKGFTGCRLAMPRGHVPQTGPMELRDITPEERGAEPQYDAQPIPEIVIGHKTNLLDESRNRTEGLYPSHDKPCMPFDSQNDRIIVWETKRKLLKSFPPIPTNLKDPDSRKNWLMNQLLLAMRPNSNDLNPSISLEAIGLVKTCL